MDRLHTCCFTGHRPEKLPPENSAEMKTIKSRLYFETKNAAKEGYKFFISGMQRGIDLYAGEIVLELMTSYDISLIAALPFPGFGSNFKGHDKWLFGRCIENAKKVIEVSPVQTKTAYKMRNEFMVENSSLLIGVVDDFKSGAGQTIALARKNGLTIRTIRVETDSGDEEEFPEQLLF